MINEKLIQAINWETIVIVCNNDLDIASNLWDKFEHVLRFPISSDFSLWAVNFNISISKLFEIYTKIKEDFKSLPKETKILIYKDENWPSQIDSFSFPARVLYCLGNIDLLKKKSVAIVGTKSPKKETVVKVEKVVKALIRNEVLVTSGLSLGIQGHAAVNSLSNFSPVISVLATDLKSFYPEGHKKIQEYIAREGGLVLTRVAPNNNNIKWNVLLRNRLMSSISSALMIIEERDRGGAVRMADYSLENKRDVFFFSALKRDKSITWPKLLIEKGAKVIRFPSDLPKAVNGDKSEQGDKKLSKEEIVQLKLF